MREIEYLHEAKRLNLRIGYDIDDPIYDQSIYVNNSNLDYLSLDERNSLLSSTIRYNTAMMAADYLLTSTVYMQNRMAKSFHGKPVYRLQNYLDSESLECMNRINISPREPNPGDRITIAYASGSRAHEADFRIVEQTVADLLDRYEHVDLQILGHLNIPERFAKHTDRIRRVPFTTHCGYLDELNKAHIVIIPLVKNNFNECKSAIRYLEAGLLKKPTLASNVGEFREAIESGVNGILCNEQDWSHSLETIILDKSFRDSLADAAHDNVLKNYTKDAVVHQIESGFREILCGAAQ